MSQEQTTTTSADVLGDYMIRHALCGGSTGKAFRKWYVTSRGSDQERVAERLCAEGRMVLYVEAFEPDSTLRCFHVTEKGAESVGLHLP